MGEITRVFTDDRSRDEEILSVWEIITLQEQDDKKNLARRGCKEGSGD